MANTTTELGSTVNQSEHEINLQINQSNGIAYAKITVIGVGGGGNNAVNRMIDADITNVRFVCANTDIQALARCKSSIKIQLGSQLTKGLGAGSNPEIGALSAIESKDEIIKVLQNTDLLFLTAGMGGGTGTGALPEIAKLAKEMNILTIAVVTKPFARAEGKVRAENAEIGIEKLRQYVDTILVIPNEKILTMVEKNTPILKAFKIADDVLRQGIQGISDIIIKPSIINLDFADIRAIMKDRGNAHIGIGIGKGENASLDAIKKAVINPLLETSIEGATGLIIHVSGGETLALDEVESSIALVREVLDPSANIIFGVAVDSDMGDKVVITVIATGATLPQNRDSIKTISLNLKDKNIDVTDEYIDEIYKCQQEYFYNGKECNNEKELTVDIDYSKKYKPFNMPTSANANEKNRGKSMQIPAKHQSENKNSFTPQTISSESLPEFLKIISGK